ncbi:peptidase S24-like protein [Leptospira fainei serovar Hurstbridge str. BUT 6]|uniref:Peptidase S24-like protein n=1 Tax=Leptospira fainei serovar Hurstbridge str. BUT 6 TaxID=1193011 RepID=S3V7J8_9LEPT|nr:peptidase S24-like protein [Leptospira fainei serovar Hurstbridge str. BUT 6]
MLKTVLYAGYPADGPNDPESQLDLLSFSESDVGRKIFATVKGDAWVDFGIRDRDRLLIDRYKEAKDGSIVIVYSKGEYLLKVVSKIADQIFINGPEENSSRISLELSGVRVLGVVTGVIHWV